MAFGLSDMRGTSPPPSKCRKTQGRCDVRALEPLRVQGCQTHQLFSLHLHAWTCCALLDVLGGQPIMRGHHLGKAPFCFGSNINTDTQAPPQTTHCLQPTFLHLTACYTFKSAFTSTIFNNAVASLHCHSMQNLDHNPLLTESCATRARWPLG